jgi:tetratricopeptide (TPR) repeat protein
MASPDAVTAAAAARQRGNELFKAARYDDAAAAYTDAAALACPPGAALASRPKEARAEATSAILNRAQCWLRLQRPVDAVRDCTSVLDAEPANEKALYRRAVAHEVRAGDAARCAACVHHYAGYR